MSGLKQFKLWMVLVLMQMADVCRSQGQQPPNIIATNERLTYYRVGNDDIKLNCTATGLPSPVYTWTRDGIPITTGNGVVIESRGEILRFSNPTEDRQAAYACRASNSLGTAISDIFNLKYAYLRTFPTETNPQNLRPRVGEYLRISCTGKPECVPAPKYEWLKGQPAILPLDDRVAVDQDGTLHFANILPGDSTLANNYACRVTNTILNQMSVGSIKSMTTQVGNASPSRPVIQFKTVAAPQTAIVGRPYELQCIFSGYSTPTVSWRAPGNRPINGLKMLEDFDRKLIFSKVEEEDEGTYTCTGSNNAGKTDQTITVEVASEPLWVKKLEDVTVAQGQVAELHCETRTAHNRFPPSRPDWLSNGATLSIAQNPRYTFNAEFTTLTITHAEKSDRRAIQCRVTNKIGYTFGAAFINVLDNIVPTVTPNNQTIGVGKIVYLQARATGDPISTLTYRWLYQNQQIDPLALFPSIYVNAENTLVVNATKMTLSELKKWTGMYFVDISSSVETVRLNATVLLPGETIEIVAASIDFTWIAIVIAVVVIIVIVVIIVCMLYRNRGEDYKVDEKERAAGHDPEKELQDSGFHDLSRADDDFEKPKGDKASLSSEMKPMDESDTDSMAEYGDLDIGKFNEDGSFIGQYTNRKSQHPVQSAV